MIALGLIIDAVRLCSPQVVRPRSPQVEKETLISANSLLEHKVLYRYPASGYIERSLKYYFL